MSNYLLLPITIHAYGCSRAWQFLYSFLQAISITSTLLRVKEVSLGHVSCKTSHLFQLCLMSFKKDLAIFAYKGELCIIFYLTLCAIYSIVIFPTSVPSNLNDLLSWSINDRKASHVKCLINYVIIWKFHFMIHSEQRLLVVASGDQIDTNIRIACAASSRIRASWQARIIDWHSNVIATHEGSEGVLQHTLFWALDESHTSFHREKVYGAA